MVKVLADWKIWIRSSDGRVSMAVDCRVDIGKTWGEGSDGDTDSKSVCCSLGRRS